MIELTQEQRDVQAMVRDLAARWIAPRAREWDERGEFPPELRGGRDAAGPGDFEPLPLECLRPGSARIAPA